jgi:Protein of unknown function (DUF3485)
MNRWKVILAVIAFAMITGTAVLLATVPQRLGRPGVKATEIPGTPRMEIYLPEQVLDFSSTNQELDAKSQEMLPADTSTAQRVYFKPGIIPFVTSVVMMGTDRTSIHKAEYCLQGQGLRIDQATTDTVHITFPQPYDLPVIKIVASLTQSVNDKTITKKCVYVYWYVADGALSNDRSGMERMWSATKKLAFTGVLQRWAYVRFYAFCNPEQESAAYEQIKQMIAASVPQFQLTTGSATATVAAQK